MMHKFILAVTILYGLGTAFQHKAAAADSTGAAPRPVVVELFTSQACSDCPPADALLKRLQAQYPDMLPLDLHVTYWNGASWDDPYSLQTATDLQNHYAALRNSSEVYTPEAVVDGQQQFVGSDSVAMTSAISRAQARIATSATVPILIERAKNGISIHVGSGIGQGSVWLFGFDHQHVTHVLGGENGSRTLTEVNVVRSITQLGEWNGRSLTLNSQLPTGQNFAVLVQNQDGTILAANSD